MSNQLVTPLETDREGKYLTFSLSDEHYGIHILKVQEIIGVMHITRVPASPSYLRGVINLRGKVIPVVDLREKFSLETVPYDEKTCIIVVDVMLAGKRINIGIIVDTVVEVVHFNDEDIEPSPDYGQNLSAQFIDGMGRAPDKSVVILIDIDKVLSDTPAAKFFQNQSPDVPPEGH